MPFTTVTGCFWLADTGTPGSAGCEAEERATEIEVAQPFHAPEGTSVG